MMGSQTLYPHHLLNLLLTYQHNFIIFVKKDIMSHIYPQDFKYGVINTVDLANVDFDETIYPTSPTSLRYSLDGSQFLIKWEEGHQPEFITNGTVVPASILSWADCNALMQTPAWSEPEPPIEE